MLALIGGCGRIGFTSSQGTDLALSVDAGILAVSALGESSAATGVNGDQASNAAQYSGAAYVFR